MKVDNWALVNAINEQEVNVGDLLRSFRGEIDECLGGTPPHKPSSTGFVSVRGGRYYPSVFGLKWIKEA
jgi:hypothetical protein